MASVVSALMSCTSAAYEYLTSSSSEEKIMVEFQPFGACAWQTHLGLNLDSPEVPASMLERMEKPCLFWPNKLTKETHILCLVSKNLTADELFDLASNPSSQSTIRHPDKGAYWILATKEIIPTSVGCFETEKDRISKLGYDIPSVLEAATAVLSVKYLTGLSIYPTQERATICSDDYNNQRVTVGAGLLNPFDISPYNLMNGIAGVIRSEPIGKLG